MAAAKMETAAERYRRIKEERLKQTELFDFKSPSGMEWKLRRPDLPTFITSGMMPMSFAAKLVESKDGGSGFADLDWTDQARTIEFSAKVVRYCAVEPRIVENPTGPNEIGFDEVEQDDYLAIFTWAMPAGGGEAAEGLGNFHSE